MSESTPIRDFVITYPKPGKWEMTLAPGLVFRPSEEVGAPNAFHRFMQRVFFGFKWEHHN